MMPLFIGVGFLAFAFSYLIGGAFILWARKRQIIDHPNERSSHTFPTPRGGGLAIVATTLVGTWVLWKTMGMGSWSGLLLYTLGALLVANVSWLDDLRSLPNSVKFIAHALGAVAAIAGFGYWQQVNIPFNGPLHLGWIGGAITFCWIVGLTNAYNFMDGSDGLAGLQAVIAGLAWALIGWMTGNQLLLVMGLLVAGSSLGFLGHNWPPARIFMGDVGSAFLGYTFALFSLICTAGKDSRQFGGAPLVGLLLLWPFVFDTSFTFLRRLSKGENIFRAHRSHLYQRLLQANKTPSLVALLYGALALAGAALGETWSPSCLTGNVNGAILVVVLAAGLWLFVVSREKRSALPTPVHGYALKYQTLVIVVSQAILLTIAYYASFMLRLDLNVPEPYLSVFLTTLPLVILIGLLVFAYFRLFRGWWQYAGMSDLLDIIRAAVVSALLIYAAVGLTRGFKDYPRSVFIINPILTVLILGGARFAVRVYSENARLHLAQTNTLIIGAGRAGSSIVRELKENEALDYNAVGFVDDDPTKRGVKIQGVKVLGSTEELPRLIAKHEVAHIFIAIPSASGAQIQRIVDKCRECKVDFKTLPAIGDIITNHYASVGHMRSIRVDDLLVRQPIRIDLARIRSKLSGKTVLITGAAGSIGSEMSRQIAELNPAKLVLFERSESDLFQIHLELSDRFPSLACVPIVGDILDVNRLRDAFNAHRPNSVFHAAAYKHVPMMEMNCFQAVNNNVFGTYNVALVSRQSGVEDFVMISSDKAVNPSNIMGVTKRVAELLILGLQHQATRFVSVRFGNVLGSRGSVIPLFEQQIAARKPITITDPEARRYFMTTKEAVQLVLQASAMGKGGEIFMLDMGQPVKIVDLARTLIKLSGLEPEADIPIVYTGLRPGEKLFEEVKLEGEGIKPTSHEKIRVLDGGEVSLENVRKWLDELAALSDSRNVHGLIMKLKEIVPEYKPSREILEQAEVDRFDKFASYNRARAGLSL
jgi:FlaA1/EpsC-like NDP-sugar epimerase/UDP-N-acetylmuramyl pentapeptide phosphotransferase/UDP-N-acetylglucosamine-1-phosphate transferase